MFRNMRTLLFFLCVGILGLSASADSERMLGLSRLPKGRLQVPGARQVHGLARESIDWRSHNGINWLKPVKNQGSCGSCVAFSTIATLEAQIAISTGVSWSHPAYSTEALFSCGGGSCEGGWIPESALEYLQSRGVPDEACMPNTSSSTGIDTTCSDRCSDWQTRNYHILGYTNPTNGGGDVDTVKAALKKGPLVTTMKVYEDFLSYKSGVYAHKSGSLLGGHAVSLVGFDDAKRAWLVQNSWGSSWGDGGFIWISWDDDSGVGSETWGFDIAPIQNTLSITYPTDRAYVSGQVSVAAQSKFALERGVQFHLSDSNGRELESYRTQSTYLVDTTKLPDGRYQIYAESLSVPVIKSQVREFWILNHEPTMSLSVAPVKKLKPNGKINGRIEFDIKATFSPIPIQALELRVFDSQGKPVAVSRNEQVLSKMKMGWRTQMVPNGHYNLMFHAETNYAGKAYSVDSKMFEVVIEN